MSSSSSSSYCFRQNEGYCSVEYQARNNNGFSSVLTPDNNNGDNLKSSNSCNEDYFVIPQGRNVELGSFNNDVSRIL